MVVFVLRITAVSAGAVDYLIRGSGCAGHDHAGDGARGRAVERDGPGADVGHPAGRGTGGAAGYFGSAVASGEAPGRWMGSGLGLLGVDASRPVSEEVVRAVFGRLEHPVTGESLGRAPRRFKTYQQRLAAAVVVEPLATPERRRELEVAAKADGRKAVAYYDFTFSPVKSVSVYYAALLAEGLYDDAALVVAAHRDAVRIAMEYAEGHVAYTRVGYHGRTADGRSVGRYEAAQGLIATGWEHSTNRETEPQLHTHVAVLNRAVTRSDGRVRALDGRGFRPIKEAVATAYERAVEQRLAQSLGVVFAQRADGKAREILGVDPVVCAQASTRRAQVLGRLDELVADYTERHGRVPDPATRKALAQAATLDTRAPKGDGRAGPVAVLAWARRRGEVMAAVVDGVAAAAAWVTESGHPDTPGRPDPADRAAVLAAAVAAVQGEYATWTLGNLVAGIDAQLVDLDVPAGQRPAVLEEMARQALAPDNPFGVLALTAGDPVAVPGVLARPEDGRSVFRPHIDERYATGQQLATETRIVTAARAVTAPAISAIEVELLRVELAADGLGADQVDAVAGIMASGRAGDVLIGPAGTGKSVAVAALAQAWTHTFGGRVLGLATSQRATDVLIEEGLTAVNTSVFLRRFTPDQQGGVTRDAVRRGDLFIVDEASMTATTDLDRISELVRVGGGKLVFTGDPHQLGAVGAGGLLELLAGDNGAHELARVHRFTAGWEGPASARLRTGDPAVLVEYEDRGRLYGGTIEQMRAAAVTGYLADTLAGHESLLLVGSNAEAARLGGDIRDELIALGRIDAAPLAWLRDGCPVSAGDVVQARRNAWTIPLHHTNLTDSGARAGGVGRVTNRETYQVLRRTGRGELVVARPDGATAILPAGYVCAHLTLGYASTVHAAQGRTVDTAHTVLGEQARREDAYVGLTRGRHANTAYLTTARAPDSHDPERLTGTAVGRLAAILDSTGNAGSAELQRRLSERDGVSLAWIGTQWDQVSAEYARDRYTDALAALLPAPVMDDLVAEPGFPRLIRAVRHAELAGHTPDAILTEAVHSRGGGGGGGNGGGVAAADSVADVLRWRVRLHARRREPEQRVDPANWTTWAAPVDGPVGQYLHELAVLAGDRQAQIGRAAAVELPDWATTPLGPPPDEPSPREGWIRAAGIAGAYRELACVPDDTVSLGPAPSPEQVCHRVLWRHATSALGLPTNTADLHTASESQLREMIRRWDHAQASAPEYVADQLRDAHILAEHSRRQAILDTARLAAHTTNAPGRDALALTLAHATHTADHAAQRVRQLEATYTERRSWSDATQDLLAQARLSAEELIRRGLPLDPPAAEPDLDSVDPVGNTGPGPLVDEIGVELMATDHAAHPGTGPAIADTSAHQEHVRVGEVETTRHPVGGRATPFVDSATAGQRDIAAHRDGDIVQTHEQTRHSLDQASHHALAASHQGRQRCGAATVTDQLRRHAATAEFAEADRQRRDRGAEPVTEAARRALDHDLDRDERVHCSSIDF